MGARAVPVGALTRAAALLAAITLVVAALPQKLHADPRHTPGPPRNPPLTEPVSPTPYMGVDTWYAFGADIDQKTIVGLADAIVRRGLRAAGYRYLWLDDGWWQGARDARGNIVISRSQWPRGMRWLTAYLHRRGLEAGIYTDAGADGCMFPGAGSYGHYRQDVDTFARWGFDAVKVDFCGGNQMALDPHRAYPRFGAAIASDHPRRPMVFAISDGAIPNQYGPDRPPLADSAYQAYRFAPRRASSWRTSYDEGMPGAVTFAGVLQDIAADARHPRAATPGHWNDPDYLAPDEGMTPSEAQAQFTMWAILAAPLMLSADVRTMPESLAAMARDREVIAIDQDPGGIQGRMLSIRHGVQIWIKPLSGGGQAVALLNPGASAATVRLRLGRRSVREVWAHLTRLTSGTLRATVEPQSARLFRVMPAPPRARPRK